MTATAKKRATKKAAPDPKRTPERLADAFMPRLLKHNGANLVCTCRDEALDLSRELRQRGWKAKAAMGLNIQTRKAFDYVEVAGRKGAYTAWVMES